MTLKKSGSSHKDAITPGSGRAAAEPKKMVRRSLVRITKPSVVRNVNKRMRIGQSKIEEAVLDAEWLRDDESRKSAKRGFMELSWVCDSVPEFSVQGARNWVRVHRGQ